MGNSLCKSNSCGGPHQTGDTCQIVVALVPPVPGYSGVSRLTIVTPDDNQTYGVDIFINSN